MKNLSRNLCIGLFSLCILLTGGGCIDVGSDEIGTEDVTSQEPYSKFIGAKYKLKRGCYLAISSSGIDSSSEDIKARNEFIKECCNQKGINAISANKAKFESIDSSYYIVACGHNGAPAELNEKYIGTEAWGGTIIALLTEGTEFTVRNITITYYIRTFNRLIIFTSPLVEIPSIKIIANAHLLVRGRSDTLVFEWRYVEMVDPEPEKK